MDKQGVQCSHCRLRFAGIIFSIIDIVEESGWIRLNEEPHERPSEFYGYALVIFGIVISSLGMWLSVTIVRNLGSVPEMNWIAFMRNATCLMFLFVVFPMSIVVEMMYAHWKKRKPHLLGVSAIALMLLEVVAALFVTGYVFDLLFPGLSFTNEPVAGLTGTVLGLMIGLPLIVAALTIRTSKARAFLHKAFPD